MATPEEIEEVRLNIGDTSSPYVLSDTIVGNKIDAYAQPPYTSPQAVYFATLDCLVLLKANSISSSSSLSRTKVGDVEVENETGQDSSYRLYCDLYEFWLRNPPKGVSGKASFSFGGVSKEEVDRVRQDSDSIGAGIKQGWYEDSDFELGNSSEENSLTKNYRDY